MDMAECQGTLLLLPPPGIDIIPGWCAERSQAVQKLDKASQVWLNVAETFEGRGEQVVEKDNRMDEARYARGRAKTLSVCYHDHNMCVTDVGS